jgi:hypothetical protein
MRPAERACFGADIHDGLAIVQGPTARTIAGQVGVSISALWAALPAYPVSAPVAEPGADRLGRLDDTTLADIVHAIGPDRVLAAAVEVERTNGGVRI